MLFSFNNGRSRSVWQGFSIRWWWGDPSLSIFHDPDYMHALVHSLELAALDMLIATPLGVLLALGLARWRGRGSGVANSLMLVPLVTPEIVMADVAAAGVHPAGARPVHARAPRDPGAGDRPGHVLAFLRGRDRPRPAWPRSARSTRRRPVISARRRVRVAAARAAAAADAGDPRQHADRVRALDRRLRRHPVHVLERVDDDDPDVPVRQRPRRHDHAGAERAGDRAGARRRWSGSGSLTCSTQCSVGARRRGNVSAMRELCGLETA